MVWHFGMLDTQEVSAGKLAALLQRHASDRMASGDSERLNVWARRGLVRRSLMWLLRCEMGDLARIVKMA